MAGYSLLDSDTKKKTVKDKKGPGRVRGAPRGTKTLGEPGGTIKGPKVKMSQVVGHGVRR